MSDLITAFVDFEFLSNTFNNIFHMFTDYKGGILRVWSVSNSTPIENIKIKGTGFHSLDVISQSVQNSQIKTAKSHEGDTNHHV